MNSIIMNLDDTADINVIYSQLKKQYPKFEIIKSDNKKSAARLRAMTALKNLQKQAAESEAAEMTMEEIDAEISEYRKEKQGKK